MKYKDMYFYGPFEINNVYNNTNGKSRQPILNDIYCMCNPSHWQIYKASNYD